MKMIIGGAYQGKLHFAMKKYDITEDDVFDIDICAFEEIYHKRCINHYERVIKVLMERNENSVVFTENLIKNNSDSIIIMNEIGGGRKRRTAVAGTDRENRLQACRTFRKRGKNYLWYCRCAEIIFKRKYDKFTYRRLNK